MEAVKDIRDSKLYDALKVKFDMDIKYVDGKKNTRKAPQVEEID